MQAAGHSPAPASGGSDDGRQAKRRDPLRVWLVLLAVLVVLALACIAVVWGFLRSDGDVRELEAEAAKQGIDLREEPQVVTGAARMAQARQVDVLVSAIPLPTEGLHAPGFRPERMSANADFREFHRSVPSSAVRAAAEAIIGLGSLPMVRPPPTWFSTTRWEILLNNRIIVAEDEELDLCLAANRVVVEMALGHQRGVWGWSQLKTFCVLLLHRLPDQRERLRPQADWLEVQAENLLRGFPGMAQAVLRRDFRDIRSGEQFFNMRGMGIPKRLDYGFPLGLNLAVRVERARILKAEMDWLSFLRAHPMQPRAWLDEAGRRSAAIASEGSWLSIECHQSVLIFQHPLLLRRLLSIVLHARLIAAELRGTPWPVDVLDSTGAPLRRWMKDGRQIGAYSVGPDGIDDGGDPNRDIQLRLVLDPPPAKQP